MKTRYLLAPLAALVALSACNQPGKTENPAETATSTAPDAKPGAQLSEGRLVLPAVKGNPGAAYFTLANSGEKAVTIAAIAVDGAAKAEMHQTTGGQMAPVDKAEVAPGAALKFAPGGYHVMLFELDPKLAAGGTAEITVTFADGDKLSAPLTIEAAGGSDHAMGDMGGMDMGDHH